MNVKGSLAYITNHHTLLESNHWIYGSAHETSPWIQNKMLTLALSVRGWRLIWTQSASLRWKSSQMVQASQARTPQACSESWSWIKLSANAGASPWLCLIPGKTVFANLSCCNLALFESYIEILLKSKAGIFYHKDSWF